MGVPLPWTPCESRCPFGCQSIHKPHGATYDRSGSADRPGTTGDHPAEYRAWVPTPRESANPSPTYDQLRSFHHHSERTECPVSRTTHALPALARELRAVRRTRQHTLLARDPGKTRSLMRTGRLEADPSSLDAQDHERSAVDLDLAHEAQPPRHVLDVPHDEAPDASRGIPEHLAKRLRQRTDVDDAIRTAALGCAPGQLIWLGDIGDRDDRLASGTASTDRSKCLGVAGRHDHDIGSPKVARYLPAEWGGGAHYARDHPFVTDDGDAQH